MREIVVDNFAGGGGASLGIECALGQPGTDDDGWAWQDWSIDPRIAYRRLWDSINAKRGYGWNVNPWIWVIEFERINREAIIYLTNHARRFNHLRWSRPSRSMP